MLHSTNPQHKNYHWKPLFENRLLGYCICNSSLEIAEFLNDATIEHERIHDMIRGFTGWLLYKALLYNDYMKLEIIKKPYNEKDIE